MSYAALKHDPPPGPLTPRDLLRMPRLRYTGRYYWMRDSHWLQWMRLPIARAGSRRTGRQVWTIEERREIFQLLDEGYPQLGIIVAYGFPIYYYPPTTVPITRNPLQAYQCFGDFIRYYRAWWEREKADPNDSI